MGVGEVLIVPEKEEEEEEEEESIDQSGGGDDTMEDGERLKEFFLVYILPSLTAAVLIMVIVFALCYLKRFKHKSRHVGRDTRQDSNSHDELVYTYNE